MCFPNIKSASDIHYSVTEIMECSEFERRIFEVSGGRKGSVEVPVSQRTQRKLLGMIVMQFKVGMGEFSPYLMVVWKLQD
jgi:hypothetical protein